MDNSSFRQRMGRVEIDEDMSETSEYQSDNGCSEIIEDISNGPLSSTPVMKKRIPNHLRTRY